MLVKLESEIRALRDELFGRRAEVAAFKSIGSVV
jgi:hypothetical protein